MGKKGLIGVLLALLVGGGGYYAYEQQFGAAIQRTPEAALFGEVDNLSRWPITKVEANATTTDPALNQGGSAIQQQTNARNARSLTLMGLVKGGTATSTAVIHPQVSFDNVNWFNVRHSTSTLELFSTSTVNMLDSVVLSFDPGVSTTTFTHTFTLPGAEFVRFIFQGEDVSTGPNDGIFGWLTVVSEGESDN